MYGNAIKTGRNKKHQNLQHQRNKRSQEAKTWGDKRI